MIHKLTTPAPRRYSLRSEAGFYDVPWTEAFILRTLLGGGWFRKSGHCFESPATASFAFSAQEAFYEEPLE